MIQKLLNLKSFNLKSIGHKPKKSAVSIYIGPNCIEIAQAKRTNGVPSIIKTIYKEISKEDLSGQLIKDIFKSEGIKETSVTTTIPEESIMLRRFSMPIIPPQERESAIKFEAKRHIPFNIEEVFSCYYIIKEDHEKNKMDILFTAVKKNEINSIIDILTQAELKIERIEPISLALIKTLILSGALQESFPPTAILHFITKTRAQIIIAADGIPYIKREVSLIGREDKIEEQIQTELRLSASYYKREFPEKNITKLIVCGLRERPSWLTSIKSSLDMPVDQATPLKSLGGKDLPHPQLEISIGLASRMLETPAVSLNLLPKQFLPAKYDIQKIIGIEIFFGIAILALVFILGIPSTFKLNMQISQAEKAKTEYPELNLASKSIQDLEETKNNWQQRKYTITTLTKQKINWHQKLISLASIMPQETWVTELNFGDYIGKIGKRFLRLQCTTYAKEPEKEIKDANSFLQSLRRNSVFMNGFKNIKLGKIDKTKIENYEVANFDISAD